MDLKPPLPMLFPLEPEAFFYRMRQIVQEELRNATLRPSLTEGEESLLGRKEVARRLRISLVTLNDWVKRGLPAHKQRGRVYFLYSEVMAYIQQTKLKKALELQSAFPT